MNKEAKTVLIVEDDARLCATLELALQSRGYHALVAQSPVSALQLMRETPPDLIVSDVHFSDGDGRELLVELRREDGLAARPFVLMTGDPKRVSWRDSMNLGADDYLAKPFTAAEFLDCVQARLKRAEILENTQRRLVTELRGSVTRSLPHELFTPLNGIMGFAEVLRQDPFPVQEVQEMADTIYRCSERLLRAIRNYLAILDLMDGPWEFRPEPESPVSARQMESSVEEVVLAMARDAERSRDVAFAGELDPEAEYALEPDCVKVVARELVDNALKFSSRGSQVMACLREEGHNLVLVVTDSGRGLSPERIRSIGIFRQFDRSRYAQQGLGLGLTLAQQLLARFGGELSIESIPHHGTTVRASWPLRG